jgi:hypothetical protein
LKKNYFFRNLLSAKTHPKAEAEEITNARTIPSNPRSKGLNIAPKIIIRIKNTTK